MHPTDRRRRTLVLRRVARIPGGWEAMAAAAPARFHLYRPPTDPEAPFLGLVIATFGVFLFYQSTNQVMIQRVLSARSTRDGVLGIIFAGFINLARPMVTSLLGLIVYHWLDILHHGPTLLPDQQDQAFPYALAEFAPTGIRGVILAGFLAAIMSAMSSLVNAIATIFSLDIYKRFIRTNAGDAELITTGRIAAGCALVVAAIMAPWIANIGLFRYFQTGITYMATPFISVVLLGIFWRRTSYAGAIAGLIGGLIIQVSLALGLWARGISLHWLYVGGLAELLTIMVIVGFSLCTSPPLPEQVEPFLWRPGLVSRFMGDESILVLVETGKSMVHWIPWRGVMSTGGSGNESRFGAGLCIHTADQFKLCGEIGQVHHGPSTVHRSHRVLAVSWSTKWECPEAGPRSIAASTRTPLLRASPRLRIPRTRKPVTQSNVNRFHISIFPWSSRGHRDRLRSPARQPGHQYLVDERRSCFPERRAPWLLVFTNCYGTWAREIAQWTSAHGPGHLPCRARRVRQATGANRTCRRLLQMVFDTEETSLMDLLGRPDHGRTRQTKGCVVCILGVCCPVHDSASCSRTQALAIGPERVREPLYAAAAKSMLVSPGNFLFGSFDPGGFVTVDKPPVSLWIQAASAGLFGYSGHSLLIPQASWVWPRRRRRTILFGRCPGPTTGLLASLAMAVTPVSVAIDRDNMPDTSLVLVLLLATWALCIAAETGRFRPLVVMAALVGLGFNIKMLAAFVVLPTFYLVYLVVAPGSWMRRLGQLAAATVVLAVVSLSWSIVVELTPKDKRPYIGGSQTIGAGIGSRL